MISKSFKLYIKKKAAKKTSYQTHNKDFICCPNTPLLWISCQQYVSINWDGAIKGLDKFHRSLEKTFPDGVIVLIAISKLIRYKDRIPQRLIHLKVNTEGDPMLHVFTAKLK